MCNTPYFNLSVVYKSKTPAKFDNHMFIRTAKKYVFLRVDKESIYAIYHLILTCNIQNCEIKLLFQTRQT